MRCESPVLSPDAKRPVFFDGMNEEQARLTFACVACGTDNEAHVLSFVSRAERWFDALDDDSRLHVVRLFRTPLGESLGKVVVRSHDDASPSFGLASCVACDRAHLVYLSFGEVQPARYQARLHGLALLAADRIETTPIETAPIETTPIETTPIETTSVAPVLSLAIPLASGRLLLRFNDGQWGLTHTMLRTNLQRFAAGPLGMAWGARGGFDVVGLHASSEPIIGVEHTWLIGCRGHAPGAGDTGHREVGFMLHPFASEPLVLYETHDQDERTETFTLASLRAFDGWQQRLQDAGCAWVIDAISSADHDMHAMQAVVSTAVRRGDTLHDPFPLVIYRSDRRTDRRKTGRLGWYAKPGEPRLRYVTTSNTENKLVGDIANVVERMQRRRVADNARGADMLSFRALRSRFELRAHWYDPENDRVIGDWQYTLELRHLKKSIGSAHFEDVCRAMIGLYSRNHKPLNIKIHF